MSYSWEGSDEGRNGHIAGAGADSRIAAGNRAYKEDKEVELSLVALLLLTGCIPWALYFLYLVAIVSWTKINNDCMEFKNGFLYQFENENRKFIIFGERKWTSPHYKRSRWQYINKPKSKLPLNIYLINYVLS